LLFACRQGGEVSRRPAAGRPAPAFQAVTLAGDTVSLEALRGSTVLLNLWATWCAPCRRETPYLQSLHEKLAPQGLVVVGVSVDAFGAERDVEEFMTEFGVTYQILHDPAMRSLDVFSAIGLPATYLIGKGGTLLWVRLGPVEPGDPEFERELTAALASADAR
jgi:thiol-disulfide isomerase/thioredoxin